MLRVGEYAFFYYFYFYLVIFAFISSLLSNIYIFLQTPTDSPLIPHTDNVSPSFKATPP